MTKALYAKIDNCVFPEKKTPKTKTKQTTTYNDLMKGSV